MVPSSPSQLLSAMASVTNLSSSKISRIYERWEEDNHGTDSVANFPGWLFKGQVLYFAQPTAATTDPETVSPRLQRASNTARFAGAAVANSIEDKQVTHVVVDTKENVSRNKQTNDSINISAIRSTIAKRAGQNRKVPHIVTVNWVEDSWKERTLIDEGSKFHHPWACREYTIPGTNQGQ